MRWLHGRYLFGSFSAIIFGRKRKNRTDARERKEEERKMRSGLAIDRNGNNDCLLTTVKELN